MSTAPDQASPTARKQRTKKAERTSWFSTDRVLSGLVLMGIGAASTAGIAAFTNLTSMEHRIQALEKVDSAAFRDTLLDHDAQLRELNNNKINSQALQNINSTLQTDVSNLKGLVTTLTTQYATTLVHVDNLQKSSGCQSETIDKLKERTTVLEATAKAKESQTK